MSFNAKNLRYESEEPAFLRRLRGEVGGQDSARYQRAIARPRKHKNPNDHDDDEPTYVDEHNHGVMTKPQFEALVTQKGSKKTEHEGVSQSEGQSGEQAESAIETNLEGSPPKEHVAFIGGSSKRRLAKVVGDEEASSTLGAEAESRDINKAKNRKGKKIKLSFVEDTGDSEARGPLKEKQTAAALVDDAKFIDAQFIYVNLAKALTMLCAISGDAPQSPVASRKSGNVFEKRLIEAYIAENGKDPVTNEELTTDDLVELKSARIVKPRPPTLTSIPSLLSVFQNEWDALALETYNLRQHLTQTRQELSTALYQHDAAVRVIARLSRERDEARDALSKIMVNGGGASNGDEMQVDGPELSSALVAKIESTQEKLSKTRRKRVLPDDWATSDDVKAFEPIEKSKSLYPGAGSLSTDASGDMVLLGGDNGVAGVYSASQNKIVQEMEVGSGAVTDTIWAGTRAIVSTSSGVIKVFEDRSEVASFSGHAGKVTALALHPSGDILASVGVDKSYILYDLTSNTQATQIYTDANLTCAGFHPDGHLFAAGGSDGQIKVFDVKTGTNAANFDGNGAIQALAFSENGTWLAVVVKGSTSVSIWDLRKSSQLKVLDIGSPIESVVWDYTGQFLVVAGPSGLSVQQYSKSTKGWSEPLRSAIPTVAVAWGAKAQSLISLNAEGIITLLGSR